MANFWEKLKKSGQPILVLAPMAGVTDSPFRQICREFGADVLYSEMASVAALAYAPAKTLAMLASQKSEAPYVIQLFGAEPKQFAKAACLLTDKKKIKAWGIKNYHLPDGLDINFGCPVPKVLKQGAGAALFKDLKKSRLVIEAVLNSTNLPVSIKIRAAAGSVKAEDFLKNIQPLPISAVMIHGRTLTQGFSGSVDAQIIKEARQYFSGVILANGGVKNLLGGEKLLAASGADGLGLATGALGRPWLFQELKKGRVINKNSKEIFALMLKHAKLVKKYNNNFQEFRKHLLWYVGGLPNSKKLRQELMAVNNFEELKNVISNF